MLFNSYQFIVFFPIVVLIYYIIPSKARQLWLLITSYYFYMCWDAKYALLIVTSTVITYLTGITIEYIRNTNRYTPLKQQLYCKISVFICCLLNLGILIFFKYFTWLLECINDFFNYSITLPFSIILPVGISFYTFQAIGYTIDVYRNDTPAEKNFLQYALFVSFFPQLIAGPIERSKNLLSQLHCHQSFNYDNVKNGLLLMAWGFFEKIVIADKATIFVDTVYNNYQQQDGSIILLATFLFSIQIYCDFGGYSHIAIGAARVLNIDLMNNFRQPYFALNIKDFWARWHISLSSWFRDYLYIPLGGNRCSRFRKNVNLLITFLVSGIWHGASAHYVLWGAAHGIYQIASDYTTNMRRYIRSKITTKTNCFSYHLLQRIITFSIVSMIWMSFRATSISELAGLFKQIIFNFNPTAIIRSSCVFEQGLSSLQFAFLIIAILILLCVDYMHEKKKSIIAFLNDQNIIFRWIIYYSIILIILTSVIQTFGQNPNTFIYFQF